MSLNCNVLYKKPNGEYVRKTIKYNPNLRVGGYNSYGWQIIYLSKSFETDEDKYYSKLDSSRISDEYIKTLLKSTIISGVTSSFSLFFFSFNLTNYLKNKKK